MPCTPTQTHRRSVRMPVIFHCRQAGRQSRFEPPGTMESCEPPGRCQYGTRSNPKFVFIISRLTVPIDKKIIIPLAAIAAIAIVSGGSLDSPDTSKAVFHATLASPDLYKDGVFTDTFTADSGEYVFGFVPSGSSPEVLSITLSGEGLDFREEFRLNSTETDISGYLTWDYDGQKAVSIPVGGKMTIVVDPNGDVNSAISVDILKR